MVIKLFYNDSIFIESELKDINNLKGVFATLKLDEDTRQAILEYSPDAPLVDQRTAERLAKSICRTGCKLKSNRLVGANFNLKISSSNRIRSEVTSQDFQETASTKQKESALPQESIDDAYTAIVDYFWIKMFDKSVLFDIRGKNDKKVFVTKLKLQT